MNIPYHEPIGMRVRIINLVHGCKCQMGTGIDNVA